MSVADTARFGDRNFLAVVFHEGPDPPQAHLRSIRVGRGWWP